MKKVLFGTVLFAAMSLGFASCGDEGEDEEESGGISVCDCVELMEKMKDADDKDKFEEEHKDEFDACKEIGEERREELKDASDEEKEELQKKWEEEIEDCE